MHKEGSHIVLGIKHFQVEGSRMHYHVLIVYNRVTVATDKCKFPYYGGCPFTRECLTSALDVGCPRCLPGFVDDPANPGGACLRELD